MKYFTYGELTQRIGTMIICEEMDQRYRNYIDMKYKYNDDLSQEEINLLLNTYHWYIITKETAEYLQNKSDELIYYDEELNAYAWGIGTGNADMDWRNEVSTVKKYDSTVLAL